MNAVEAFFFINTFKRMKCGILNYVRKIFRIFYYHNLYIIFLNKSYIEEYMNICTLHINKSTYYNVALMYILYYNYFSAKLLFVLIIFIKLIY